MEFRVNGNRVNGGGSVVFHLREFPFTRAFLGNLNHVNGGDSVYNNLRLLEY